MMSLKDLKEHHYTKLGGTLCINEIRKDGIPPPLFNIDIRMTGSRSGKGGSEGEDILPPFLLTNPAF
jgi:hypothetical protein